MKKSVPIIVIIVIGVAALWFFLNKKPSPSITSDNKITSVLRVETVEVVTLTQNKQKELSSASLEDDFSDFESEVFKSQVKNIANQYANTARFPVGSQPIINVADARQPEPFEETEVETPFDTGSGLTIGVSAAVDKFQYFTDDRINVRVELTGLEDGVFVKAEAIISGPQGDTSLTDNLEAVGSTQSVFTGSFDTSLTSNENFSTEMFVKILIEVGGEPFFTTVAFNYATTSAQLVGLGLTQPRGANLEIPFEYTVFQSGYYFVSAVLKDQQTGKPLIALQTEGIMRQGNGQLVAKAHIQALKEAGSEGPYLLTNIKAYRGAERGEKFDVPASTVRNQYKIGVYQFTEYNDEAYQDPLVQERVEFLNQLGSLEGEESTSGESQGGD